MKKPVLFFITVLTLNFELLTFNSFSQYTKLLDLSATTSGKLPQSSLFFDGTFLYGTTQQGGTNNKGTIFKMKPNGTGYLKLLDFSGVLNGSYPAGALISDGTYLYGTTPNGGTGACSNGCGVIFKVKPDGTGFSKLYDFTNASDGKNPYASLISDGTFLYGMTYSGGVNDSGTVFKILPNGTGFTKLLDFAGASNGMNPHAPLISDGAFLYGMTENGGTSGVGVIFKIMPDGTGYAKLHDFGIALDGINPYGSLFSDGTYLYGMTVSGGTNDLGTLFKIALNGTGYSKLFDFGNNTSGYFPDGSLISDGNYLYGMTQNGGTTNKGVLFKIKSDGTMYSNVLNFDSVAHGRNPHGSLIYDGTLLYGMTYQGGAHDNGTIFKYCIASPSTFSQTSTICFKHSLTICTHNYTVAGNYLDTLSSSQGCDSIVTTHLSVDSVNTIVSVAAATLTANASPALYQWINCAGNIVIPGQTNQSFTASANGNYAVIVTENGCSDTSSCYPITTTDNNDFLNTEKISLTIFPNPFVSDFTIVFDMEQKATIVKIVDVLGKEIRSICFTGKQLVIERLDMKAGIYFLKLQNEKGIVTEKLTISN